MKRRWRLSSRIHLNMRAKMITMIHDVQSAILISEGRSCIWQLGVTVSTVDAGTTRDAQT